MTAAKTKESVIDVPELSIVVPIFNVEDYLEECLLSIEAALDGSFQAEVICVNDGSTDGSEAIALTFAARDPRFRVISQSNGGYGKAINTGMKAAKGTFFTIVESDDVITSDAYKVLLELLGRDKTLDFVKTPYQSFTVDGPKAQMAVPPSGLAAADLLCASPPVAPVTYRADALIFQPPAIWSGIYRRSRLEQFRITLPETPGAGYQDTCFSAMCLLNGLKYHWVTDRYYMYRVDRETASRHMKNRRDEMVLLFDFIRKNLQGNRRWGKDSKPCFYAVYFRRLIWFMQRVSPDYQFKLFLKAYRSFEDVWEDPKLRASVCDLLPKGEAVLFDHFWQGRQAKLFAAQ